MTGYGAEVLPRRRSWGLFDALRVFNREWAVWRPDWRRHVIFVFAESFVAVAAFGLLLGQFVVLPDGRSYLDFVAPTMTVATCLQTVTLDGLYATRMNLYDRKLFESMLTAPLGPRQVIAGELCWHAFRACLAGTVLGLAFLIAGADFSWTVLFVPLFLAACGPTFSAPAMLWASLSPKFTNLQYFNTLAMTPVYFFSGVFFPIEAFPGGLRPLVQVSPLYHATVVSQHLFDGSVDSELFVHAAVFAGMAFVGVWFTVRRFVHQLS